MNGKMTRVQHFTAKDGTRLAYRDQGAGPPVLALAGMSRDGRDFDYLAPHLAGVRLIRIDSRGRGGSQWTGAATYTVPQEAQDALALLDHLGIAKAAVIGTSRGGFLGMVMAATAPQRVAGLCFNDIGPVVERAGVERIAGYIGRPPDVATLAEMAARMPSADPGFGAVPAGRWAEEAARRYVETPDGLALPYDPALGEAFNAALGAPVADAWPLFDACRNIPLALIRGAHSDVLSRQTADAMQARRPDLIRAEVPERGHIPFLDEPEALAAIRTWLDRCFPADDAVTAGASPDRHRPPA